MASSNIHTLLSTLLPGHSTCPHATTTTASFTIPIGHPTCPHAAPVAGASLDSLLGSLPAMIALSKFLGSSTSSSSSPPSSESTSSSSSSPPSSESTSSSSSSPPSSESTSSTSSSSSPPSSESTSSTSSSSSPPSATCGHHSCPFPHHHTGTASENLSESLKTLAALLALTKPPAASTASSGADFLKVFVDSLKKPASDPVASPTNSSPDTTPPTPSSSLASPVASSSETTPPTSSSETTPPTSSSETTPPTSTAEAGEALTQLLSSLFGEKVIAALVKEAPSASIELSETDTHDVITVVMDKLSLDKVDISIRGSILTLSINTVTPFDASKDSSLNDEEYVLRKNLKLAPGVKPQQITATFSPATSTLVIHLPKVGDAYVVPITTLE